jgi:hypothetical protein
MKRATDIPNLTKEVVLEAAKLSNAEARLLVANYYAAQESRKRADMQIRHLGDKDMPNVLQYSADGYARIESQIVRALQAYCEEQAVGRWSLAQHGVGPVISAGLLAHIDMDKAPTVGHIWRYGGVDPTVKWLKGEKRPWNADLKQIFWHAGQCFKRTSGSEKSYYGELYQRYKATYVALNEAGAYAEAASKHVTHGKETQKALDKGQLPASRIDARACRAATKIFLSHWHEVAYRDKFGTLPPKPFALEHLGHAHAYPIPHPELVPVV